MELRKIFLVLFITTFSTVVYSQDPHFSQFGSAPLLSNPANTGNADAGDFRIAMSYRSQWNSLQTNFNATAISVDLPVANNKFGGGVYILSTGAVGAWNSFSVGVSGGYAITPRTSKKHLLTTGLQLGLIHKQLFTNNLVFDNQYSNGNFDRDIGHNESLDDASFSVFDANFGVNYEYIKKNKKVKPYGGFALFHLNSPKESFFGQEGERLPIRWQVNAGAKWKAISSLLVKPEVFYMRQGSASELYFGMLAEYKVGRGSYHVLGGAAYRVSDAAIIHFGLKYKGNTFRISYDFNTSDLSTYTNSRGGMEFSVIYAGFSKRARRNRF